MNTSNLKNIVVLKDLPSNIVEEAIVVLKQNQKAPKLELIDKDKMCQKTELVENSKEQEKSKDYIIKEAQMLVAEYISKIENKNKKENLSIQNLKKKNKKLKMINHLLVVGLILSGLIQFVI